MTSPTPSTSAADDRCPTCHKPTAICVCALCEKRRTRVRVVVLQHPREQDRDLGTVPILEGCLEKCSRVVGLSWPSLAKAVGEDADASRWAVVYPYLPKGVAAPDEPVTFFDRHAERRGPKGISGLLLIDGSWSQTKTLWWRNAWLLKLNRVVLTPKEPSIYGRLRKEPRATALSTLEAAADALVALGEDETLRADLRRVFRTMVQRARDVARP